MDETDPKKSVGLCTDCRNVRLIRSDRGNLFYLCQLALNDQRFAKYPRLPVLKCSGYEKLAEECG